MFFKTLDRFNYQNILPVVLPFALFLFHSLLFRNWIIDDAGISFVYSRNFALGYGFVSQPSMNPVEGFSNFTWVILMSPFFFLKTFDPIITPKIISLILVLGSYTIVSKILMEISKYPIQGTIITLLFLSSNTSFVIWTVSGLENSLYLMIVMMILWRIIKYDTRKNIIKSAITIAILSALCALSRPDGILYAGIFPFFILVDLALRKNSLKNTLMAVFLYLGVFAFIFGGYIIFRYFYFEDIFPNTYYAKGGLSLSPLEGLTKLASLLVSVGIDKFLFSGIFSIFVYLGMKKIFTHKFLVLSITLLVSLLIYVFLPSDWMPEFRFATPFFALFYIFIYLVAELFYEKTNLNRISSRVVISFLFILLLINSIPSFFQRSNTFANDPTVPFTLVTELYAHKYDEYAKALDIHNGSILLPDLGGTLYYSHLKVYDLAGLTDKVIARNLGRNQVFYDYVFDTIQPTFIHTHQVWAYRSNFDADPRFRRDYVAIHEAIDSFIFERTGEYIFSGDYVRKDSIKNNDAFLGIQTSFDEK